MYTKIIDPSMILYSGDTQKLIGTADFSLAPDAEKALLNLVNYGIKPSSLLLFDFNLYNPAPDYIPPTPYESYKRESIIKARFAEANTIYQTPIEIRLKYDVRARGARQGDQYFFDSVYLNNIDVQSVEENV